MSDKQQIKEMAHENVRATGRALEHLRLPHNPDFYYAGNTFNLALDVINALEASLQAETARADRLAAALNALLTDAKKCTYIAELQGALYIATAALSTRAKEHTAP